MEKTMTKLYLVSTSGDYSRFGMGDSNSALSIPKKYYALVKRFLKAQLNWLINVDMDISQANRKYSLERYLDSCGKLMDAGIFKNKWHCRTVWALESENELYMHEPIKIDEE